MNNVSDEKGGPILFCTDRPGSVRLAWFRTAEGLERRC